MRGLYHLIVVLESHRLIAVLESHRLIAVLESHRLIAALELYLFLGLSPRLQPGGVRVSTRTASSANKNRGFSPGGTRPVFTDGATSISLKHTAL